MGWRVVKQDDSKYAIWSTMLDGFIIINASKEEIIEEFKKKWKKKMKRDLEDLKESIDEINNCTGGYIKYQSNYSFEEYLDMIKDIHGKDEYQKYLDLIERG